MSLLSDTPPDLPQAMLETSPVGISIVSSDGIRLYANPKFAALYRYPSDAAAIGMSIRESYVNAEDHDRMTALLARDGSLSAFEVLQSRQDGQAWWCLLDKRAIDYGDQKAFISWHYDITDRKRAEHEAVEKARILETTLESMGQGLTMFDVDWKLVSYNARYREHFDLPADVFHDDAVFDDIVGATMRNDYGEDWRERLQVVRDPTRMEAEWRRSFMRPTGRSLDVLSVPVPTGGFVVTSTDWGASRFFETSGCG